MQLLATPPLQKLEREQDCIYDSNAESITSDIEDAISMFPLDLSERQQISTRY